MCRSVERNEDVIAVIHIQALVRAGKPADKEPVCVDLHMAGYRVALQAQPAEVQAFGGAGVCHWVDHEHGLGLKSNRNIAVALAIARVGAKIYYC